MKITVFVFILILFLSGCEDNFTPIFNKSTLNYTQLGEEFYLQYNNEISINGADLTIKFLSIPEDSRCQVNVVCVWEGNAHIILLLNNIDTVDLNTTLPSKEAIYKNIYKITLIEVQPLPISTQPIPLENYKVKLKVERSKLLLGK
ncbi:MAG: hypothetical protein WC557_03415 [Ignavibacteriaceae bacterium]